ncbi:MAG: energy transducer TonB [Muribaculaceae bacterium]|nr:energy transducer TonB [Muribaculaceae bacterium]
MILNFRHILYCLFTTGLMSTVAPAAAQTFRVNIGSQPSGGANYMEVFEYDYVSEKPCYPGGDTALMKFINETREYPKAAYDHHIQGRVTCSFVVNADGTVSHISIIRGVEPSLNREAIRILSKMENWIPGKLNGRNVPTRVIWSVPFRR